MTFYVTFTFHVSRVAFSGPAIILPDNAGSSTSHEKPIRFAHAVKFLYKMTSYVHKKCWLWVAGGALADSRRRMPEIQLQRSLGRD